MMTRNKRMKAMDIIYTHAKGGVRGGRREGVVEKVKKKGNSNF